MFPDSTVNNLLDGGRANTELLSKFAIAVKSFLVPFSNIDNFISRQFVGRMLLPANVYCSSFRNAIACIVRPRSKKQMVRSYARWIVTTMKDAKSFWNRPSCKNPRNAMCAHGLVTSNDYEIPVTLTFSKSPSPTSMLGFLNRRPEFSLPIYFE